jgi:hypothetical protein
MITTRNDCATIHEMTHHGAPLYYGDCRCGWVPFASTDREEVQAEIDSHNSIEHDGYARVGDKVRTATGYLLYEVVSVDEMNGTVSLRSVLAGRMLHRVLIETLNIRYRAAFLDE